MVGRLHRALVLEVGGVPHAADDGAGAHRLGEFARQPGVDARLDALIAAVMDEFSTERSETEENIRAILELQQDENGKSYSKAEIDKKLDDLLDELQITRLRTNTAMSLSGGERRRTEIARALAAEPKFILLDEPFAGVDPIAVIEIQRIIRFLKNRGIGVLITDHNVRETLGICDHAYIICDGGVLASGHPKDIVQNEDVRRAYLGEAFRM